MTITKEQIEAARRAAPVHLGPALDSTIEAVGEAMLGAQAEIAVAVKSLEWRDGIYTDAVFADTCCDSAYAVRPYENHFISVGLDFDTLEEAKAAAQADYERRILSALTTPPADEWTKVVSRLTQERDEAREENERLEELADKYKWQVRDTCVRAEKTESKMQSIANQIQENKPSPACTDEYAAGYADGRYDAWLIAQEAADNATATEVRVKALENENATMREALEKIVKAPLIDHSNAENGKDAIARAALKGDA